MSAVDDVFGSDSSDNEFDPAEEEANIDNDNEDANNGGGGSSGGGGVADALEDSDNDNNDNNAPAAMTAGGTGLSDSEGEEEQQQKQQGDADGGGDDDDDDARLAMDADVFGTDSEDEVGPTGGGDGSAEAPAGFDPFEDSDDDGDQQGGSGGGGGKTLGGGGSRLSKGGSSGKGKGKKRKGGADGSSSKKKSKTKKGEDGDNPTKKKKKKKRRRKEGEEAEAEGEGEGEEDGEKKKKKKKSKPKKKKKKKVKTTTVESSTLQDLGLESSADEAAEEEDDDDDLSDAEVEHEDEEEGLGGEDDDGGQGAGGGDVRTREDDDFIDNSDDNADLLQEYKNDAPEAGDHSEAEEDNDPEDLKDIPKHENAMTSVLASMKKRKAQDLSTAEREQIAQEFMFKINQAAEDDEEAVQSGRPALNKLKMLKTVKATLAKKELQETFLEFDLLGVVKRWLQPYSNGQLPNLTIRKEMLALMLMLPVQVDHLKRSGIGKVVMGLLNCKEETTQNKRVLRELVAKWNRPVYEKSTTHRAMRTADDDLEAMEVNPRGGGGRRRVMSGRMSQRDGASKDEAVGNILNAKERGLDPSKSRVPFSNGYAFSKAPRSRVERHGRASSQQVDTSARAKLLKKMAALARPVSKSA